MKDETDWEGTLLHFYPKSANQFYQYAKTNSMNWNLFSNAVLSRLDLSYLSELLIDSKSVEDFFYSCHAKLKLNVKYQKNKKDQILKLGNRRSNQFSRIYMEKNRLKFDHEMKGSFIEQYSQYLIINSWNDFEFLLSQHFFHYFGNQFLSLDSISLAWLAEKIISLQPKPLSTLTFKTDCLHTSIEVKDQKKRVQFLKFLTYVRDLEYDWEFLGTTRYRRVTFRLNDFLKFFYGYCERSAKSP